MSHTTPATLDDELLRRLLAEQAVFRSVLMTLLSNLFATRWPGDTERVQAFRVTVMAVLDLLRLPTNEQTDAAVDLAVLRTNELFEQLYGITAPEAPPTAAMVN